MVIVSIEFLLLVILPSPRSQVLDKSPPPYQYFFFSYFLFYFASLLFHVLCISSCSLCLVFPDQFHLCSLVFLISLITLHVYGPCLPSVCCHAALFACVGFPHISHYGFLDSAFFSALDSPFSLNKCYSLLIHSNI